MANLSNYTDLIAAIQDQFDDSSAGTTSSIRRLISQKLDSIYSRGKWPFLQKTGTITTVASTEAYSLASDYSIGGLYDVFDETNLRRLQAAAVRDKDEVFAGLTTSGSPQWYYLWGVDDSNIQKMNFYPIPSGAYTIKYRYYHSPIPVDLQTTTANDSETPILPRRYREGLMEAVLEDLYAKDLDQSANRENIKLANLIERMTGDYATDPDDMPILMSEDSRRTSSPLVKFPRNFSENYSR